MVSVLLSPSLSVSGYLFSSFILFFSLNVTLILPVVITFSFVPLPVKLYKAYEKLTVKIISNAKPILINIKSFSYS